MATPVGNAWRQGGLATYLEGAVWLWKRGLVEEDRAAGGNPQKKGGFPGLTKHPHGDKMEASPGGPVNGNL